MTNESFITGIDDAYMDGVKRWENTKPTKARNTQESNPVKNITDTLTDVYSYHVDRSPIATSTFLCTVS